MRSVWKGHFLKYGRNNFLDKSSTIFNSFLKSKLLIHGGKEKKELIIERELVGHKSGEFVFCRKMGLIHKKKEKLRRKKKGK